MTTIAAFEKKLAAIERDLVSKPMLNKVGTGAKADFREAVRRDIGDLSMSRWNLGKPIQITARFDVENESEVVVSPAGRAKGPTRVLEEGRKAGMSRGRKGGARRRRNGVVVTSTARKPRRVSKSRGKGTWTDAVKLMEKRTPGRVHDELTKTLRKHF